MSAPVNDRALVNPEAAPAPRDGGFSPRDALVGALGRAGLLGRMFPNTPTITVGQIETVVDRLIVLAADPSRRGLPRMLLGWALRRGGAARQLRSRLAIAGQLALWISGLAVLGPAAWLALRSA